MQKPSSYQKLKFKFDEAKEDIHNLQSSFTKILMKDEEEINMWIRPWEMNDPLERKFISALHQIEAEMTKIQLKMQEK